MSSPPTLLRRFDAPTTAHVLSVLVVLVIGLAACGGGGDDGTTIVTDADGIVDGADTEVVEEDDRSDASNDDAGTVGEVSGTVTLDGVDLEMSRIDRCVPSDQTTERIEEVDGIESLETLNLVANGDQGMLEVYYSDAGVRSLTLTWSGEAGVLDDTFSQVADGADWINGEGATPDGELLQVSGGIAVGGATIDGRELRFALPIPADPTC